MFTQFQEAIKKTQSHFETELQKLRTGRAHTNLLSDVQVEAYGVKTPLNQLANINVADTRMLTVEPYDKSIIKGVEKGIMNANLNLSPVVESNIIRINLPELNEETRKDLVKILKDKLEEARISVRRAREELKKKIDSEEKQGNMSEDKKRDSISELDKKTKEAVGELEEMAQKKEKEIMTI